MKKNKLIALILIFSLIAVAITFSFYFFFVVDAIRIIPMDVEVSDHSGIDGGIDALHFGMVSPEMTQGAYKFVKIDNPSDHLSFVVVSFSGEMAPWVTVNETNLVLYPEEEKELKFKLKVPTGTSYGNYTGKIKITFRRYFG